jgi:hypothetical protein
LVIGVKSMMRDFGTSPHLAYELLHNVVLVSQVCSLQDLTVKCMHYYAFIMCSVSVPYIRMEQREKLPNVVISQLNTAI